VNEEVRGTEGRALCCGDGNILVSQIRIRERSFHRLLLRA